jgi:transcriptional regulator with XRE-family HTH domain
MTFPDDAAARFASNVTRLREQAGFSQEVMADRSASAPP